MHNSVSDIMFRLFRANETRVHELNYLFWECTTRCNLHCLHCGSDCAATTGDRDMPLEDFLRAFDTIPKSEIPRNFTVVLTGGEPLLRSDLSEIGHALRRRGVGWSMVTNGYLYDRAKHSQLMDAGLGTLTISLDGLEEEHDWMRGYKGSYQRALNAITIAAQEKHINFDVVTCVNQRNLPQLQDIYNLLVSLGVPQWRIFTIIPIGRARNHPELHLTAPQFVQLMEFIKAKREATHTLTHSHTNTFMNVTFSCEGYLGRYERKVRQNPYFCHAGINIASVLIDGTICACPNIDRNAFAQGNIYHDNLWQVWQNGFQPFRDRSWARRGMCKDCKAFRNCLGNGMHNWHTVGDRSEANGQASLTVGDRSGANGQASLGDCQEVINCHYHKTLTHYSH